MLLKIARKLMKTLSQVRQKMCMQLLRQCENPELTKAWPRGGNHIQLATYRYHFSKPANHSPYMRWQQQKYIHELCLLQTTFLRKVPLNVMKYDVFFILTFLVKSLFMSKVENTNYINNVYKNIGNKNVQYLRQKQ